MNERKPSAPRARVSRVRCLFLFLTTLFLSGCVTLTDPETAQDTSRDVIGRPGEPLGQTFVSRRPRLNGLTVWLGKDNAQGEGGSGLTVELYAGEAGELDGVEPVAEADLVISKAGPVRIRVEPHGCPPGQADTVLSRASDSSTQVLGRQGEAYVGGQAFAGDQPLDADIAFRTTYEYDFNALVADLVSMAAGLWLILPLAATLFVPGWLLLDLAGLSDHFDGGEQAA
ncbi:MAG: hypothetical protein EHM70_22265, partial [Chloroflexota bacterium]